MQANFSTTNSLLQALQDAQAVQARSLAEISSGRRVSKPSDDPSASAALVRNASMQAQDDSYTAGDASLRSRFASADSALSSVVRQMTQAVSLAVEGANGTLSASDKVALAQQLSGIRDQVLSLGNTQFEGKFLFSGVNDNTAPFAANGGGTIQYQGAPAVATVNTGQGATIASGVTGDKLFGANGSSAFDALSGVISALDGNGDVAAAAAAVSTSLSNLSAQRVFFGTAMNALDGVTSSITTEKQGLSQQEDQLAGADITQAVTDLTQAQVAQGAVSAAFSKISQMSLLNYLNPPTG
ncbi:MAG: flagellar hook-associated protein FlgL [Acidobacteriaceae bacterium]